MSNPDPAAAALRWGVIGPGRIASLVVADFPHAQAGSVVAVASRSLERAAQFAAVHGIPVAYGSYQELIDDPRIDVVYIATPHTHHVAIGLAALRAGKAVLIEKAFAATSQGAIDLVAQARRSDVFAMEAMWTRFQPVIVRLRHLLADGIVGEVQSVQAELGVRREFDPDDRVFAPALGGGALLDLGVYLVSFAQMVLGQPTAVTARGDLEPNGVDARASMLVEFSGGRTATLTCSLHSPMPGHARIFGRAGWIDVLPRFHHPRTIVVHRPGLDALEVTLPPAGGGYSHELSEVSSCIGAGQRESSVMPLRDTLAVQATLQHSLDQLGVQFDEAGC